MIIEHLCAADPGMAMDLELSVTGSEPGKVSETIYCYVMNLDDPLHLHVEAEFKVITEIVFRNLSGDYKVRRSFAYFFFIKKVSSFKSKLGSLFVHLYS